MFPFYEWDDFGEIINPEDYVSKDQDMDRGLMHVTVSSSLVKMDYEGRSDGRSIKSMIAHVSPLKLVLVHAIAEATEHLKQHFLNRIG